MSLPISPIGTGAESFAKSLTAGMLQLQPQNLAALGSLAKPAEGAQGFHQLLAGAIEQTSALQHKAEAEEVKFMTGEVEELHGLMIAQEKASLAFQLTLQVRNKLVESYQEVMRMQI